ncbi:hypothetical protein H2200_008770 [Cladophialophora chaetospira]|uniref:DUF7580 domain-containing protein n=1 Tax=Cladophialophora chaetospira TaxID=386627 RepID=A0AA39CFV3_9EURO|nr:hypothetical protein H2200_008770 [Cladophialophora chaetospira]
MPDTMYAIYPLLRVSPQAVLRAQKVTPDKSTPARLGIMSGVEIVGLILGVLPLFIAAAEHFQGNTSSRRAIKDGLFADRYKVKLTTHRTLLNLYIKAVVGRTSLSPSTQAQLVDDPSSDLWQRADVAKAISEELGDAYPLFRELLKRICAALAKHISTNQTEKLSEDNILDLLRGISLEDDQSSPKLLDRIKLSFKSSERKAILAELEECNSTLEKLSRAADRAKAFEKNQQTRRAHLTFSRRDEAERLFEILRKACKCQNLPPRDVGLRLQVHHHRSDESLESNFQVLLLDSKSTICEVSARMSKSKDVEPPKKKVRVQAFTTSSADAAKKLQIKHMRVLGDICTEAKLATAKDCAVHLYVDDKEKIYTQHRKGQFVQSGSQQLVSLTDVMSRLKLYDHKRWLQREKSILAVTLAYSMLQLHESPWLRSQWNSDTISFLDESDTSSCANEQFKLRRPFTRSQVSATSTAASNISMTNPATPKPPRRNVHLHALGVVLLELYLNRSIEPEVIAQGGIDYRGVAQYLLEEHSDDMAMTAGYHRAIQFCLSPHPNPYSGSFSFEDRGFREIFYSEVIAKLEDNLMARFEVSESIWEAND